MEPIRSVSYSHIEGDVVVPSVVGWGSDLKVLMRVDGYAVLHRKGTWVSERGKQSYHHAFYQLVRFTQDRLGLPVFEILEEKHKPGGKFRQIRADYIEKAVELALKRIPTPEELKEMLGGS